MYQKVNLFFLVSFLLLLKVLLARYVNILLAV